MKAIILALTLVFSFNSFAVTIGVVNIQQILFNIKEGQEIKKKLETAFNKKKAELQKDEEKIRKAKTEYDKKASVLSDKAKMRQQQEIQKMFIELEGTRKKYQEEIGKMERELTAPVLEKARKIVSEVAKSEKVDIALDAATTPIFYAKKTVDLTKKSIELYNKKHPGK